MRPITPAGVVFNRNRTRFSTDMVQCLEEHYQDNRYPTGEGCKDIAQFLGIEWMKVKVRRFTYLVKTLCN